MQLRVSPGQITEIILLLYVSLQMPCAPGCWWQFPGGGCRGAYIGLSLPPCWWAGQGAGWSWQSSRLRSDLAGYQSSPAGSPLSDRRRAAVNSWLFVPSVCALLFNSYCIRNNCHSSSSELQMFSFSKESAAGIWTCSVGLEFCPGSLWKRRAFLTIVTLPDDWMTSNVALLWACPVCWPVAIRLLTTWDATRWPHITR